MPRTKKAQPEETPPQEGISKTEAIHQAIDKMGADASLKQIQDFASKEYGLDISKSHISTIRSELGNSGGKGKQEHAAAKAKEGISKTKAVKRALAKLGKNAMPAEIQDYVAREFGIEIGTGHISNIKSTLKSRGRKGKKSRDRAEAEPRAEVTHAGNGKTHFRRQAGVSLTDIEVAKQLADRVGVKELHALIDLVATHH